VKRREFIAALGGAAASWPLAVRAQQPARPVIGYFHFATPEYAPHAAAFLEGLKQTKRRARIPLGRGPV
jgi:putative ABC transport system substrate-binding protein